MKVTAILDIGKTNVKLCLLDGAGDTVWSRSRHNKVIDAAPYPQFEVGAVWQWLLESLSEASESFEIQAINVSTHGSCVVLVGPDGDLVLPILDYEYAGVEEYNDQYNALRPDFFITCSPSLPAGLNVGRQLFWQRQRFPRAFENIQLVLMYPQYWVWRLTDVAVTEVTSLGCHSDLWCPERADFSGLADTLGIRHKFPPLVAATQSVGCVSPAVIRETGLAANCRVYAGVHDSNASFARHLSAGFAPPFAVVSTGTWIITMAAGSPIRFLDETSDTLANVSVLGEPLACARFMGGREFEAICRMTGASVDDACGEVDLEGLVSSEEFAMPAFATGGGPFLDKAGELPATVSNGKALATLYLALMIDYELDLLGATGDIVLGSSSTKNPLLCRLLAQLRPQQRVLMSEDDASSIRGAWCLTRPGFPEFGKPEHYAVAEVANLGGLTAYRDKWRVLLNPPPRICSAVPPVN